MNKRFLMIGLLAATIASAEEKAIRLEESVITSEDSEATIADIPKNITVLTGEEIIQRGAQTVSEALKLVSSVTVRDMGGADAQFDMRGQGATSKSNVIVLLDGAPLNSIDMSGYKTSQIPVDTIERIEVIPSGGSVLYGDGAIGGTINIVTKAPLDKANYGNVGLEVGSYGMFKKEVGYGTKIGEKLLVEVDYLDRKKDAYRDYQKDNLESFGLRTKYNLENGYLGLKYNYSKTDFRSAGALTKEEVNQDREQSIFSPMVWRVDGRTEKNNFSGDYVYNINSDLEFKLLGTYTDENYYSNSSNYKTNILYLKPQMKYLYNKNGYLVIGTDYYNGETKIFKGNDLKKESFGGYLINSYTYDNKFKFTQGYRRQNIEYKNNEVNSRVNFENEKFKEDALELTASYLYSESGSTYLSYTKGFRTPNTDELAFWDSNNDFKSQTSETYELGIKDFIGNTYASGSIFYIETENEIFYGLTDSGDKKNKNYDGTTKRKGAEMSLEHYFDKLTISESLTYMETEFKEGKEIPGVPKVKAVLNLNYRITDKLTFNNSWEYYGKMYANSDEENKGEKVDDYILSGISLNYNFGNGLVINGGINNLFNEKYYEYVGYGVKGNSYYPAAERNYYAGFKYNF
ncbi:MAG: TonB-dependent receptor [Cetobacterium sp.]|uniref:TonB-dependent receptor n=1 Tax=Cetobacterium sp. TaxID=2071632 RepID=UPI002FC9A85F